MRARAQHGWALIALALTLSLSACGGGSGGGTPPPSPPPPSPPPPPTPATLTITSTSLPNAVNGMPYTATLAYTGGTGTVTWSKGTGFPSWASLDAAKGEISGTPPDTELYNMWNTVLDVKAQDSGSPAQVASASFTIWLLPHLRIQTAAPNWSSPPNGTRGMAYSGFVYATGGRTPYTWSISAGELPVGLSMSATSSFPPSAQLSGLPTKEGTYKFTVQVTDSGQYLPQQTATQEFTLVIDTKLTITSTLLKYGIKGRPYSDTPVFVNGVAPFQWSAPSLSSYGLAINAGSGEISGTPTLAAYWSGDVTVIDSSSPPQTATSHLGFQIYDNLVIPTSAGNSWTARINEDFAGGALANGGVPPLKWSMQSGTLPPALALSTSGTISGVLSQTGTWKFGLHVEDAATPPQTYDQPFSITVLPPLPMIMNSPPSRAAVGLPYSVRLIASRGTPPYSWSDDGNLPAGLALDYSSGVLSGTPTVAGWVSFHITLADSASPPQTVTYSYDVTVAAKPLGRNDSIAQATFIGNGSFEGSISPYSDNAGTPNPDTDYYKLIAAGGSIVDLRVYATPVYDWGTMLDPVVEIADATGMRFKTCMDPGDDNPTLTFIVRDTTPTAYDDECLNDDIDPGVNLNSQLGFQVPGSSTDTVTFYLHVLDSRGMARPDMTYQLLVSGVMDPLVITTDSLVPAGKGRQYGQSIVATGGTGTRTLSLASGSSLPPGLSLSSDGYLSGTPTDLGTWTFTVLAKDTGPPQQTVAKPFTLTVTEPLQIVTASLPDASTGVSYVANLVTSGGSGAPISWGFYSSNWCAINLDQTLGRFAGTALLPGTFTGNLYASDGSTSDSKTITLVVKPGPLFVKTSSLDTATVGWVYSSPLEVAGGVPPYTWKLTSGSLPPGMIFNPTMNWYSSEAEIRGIPTAAGTYTFTIQVTDSGSPAQSTFATFALTVNAGP